MTVPTTQVARVIADLKKAIADWPQLTEQERERLRADVARRVHRVV